MKKFLNNLHKMSAIAPLAFTVSVLIVYLVECLKKGNFIETINKEAPPNVLREISVYLFLFGWIGIFVCLGILITRFLFWRTNKPSLQFLLFILISIASMLIMVYLNPLHLFTWLMG